MSTIDQQFVEYIVKSLVEHPDDVSVERTIDERGVLLTLTVNSQDLGRVIGKRGMTAQSLRTLLRALGVKSDEKTEQPVENTTSSSVEKDSSYADKSRKELEELDDIDI